LSFISPYSLDVVVDHVLGVDDLQVHRVAVDASVGVHVLPVHPDPFDDRRHQRPERTGQVGQQPEGDRLSLGVDTEVGGQLGRGSGAAVVVVSPSPAVVVVAAAVVVVVSAPSPPPQAASTRPNAINSASHRNRSLIVLFLLLVSLFSPRRRGSQSPGTAGGGLGSAET
jgi:hypothetical protein